MVAGPDTLYPYELLDLLEMLHEEAFTGQVTLHAEVGRTVLYLSDGLVRYAMTSDVGGSFPAYLITEDIFPRERVHRWLEECTDEELTLEELVLQRHRVDSEGMVALKADLSRLVFARAFTRTVTAEVAPNLTDPPVFADLVLDVYEALFRSVADAPVHGAMLASFQGLWQRPIRRGPTFFRLMPRFRRWFPSTPTPRLLDPAPTLTDLTDQVTNPEDLIAQLFVMQLTGMMHFQGRAARRQVFPPRLVPGALPPDTRRRPTTQPGTPTGPLAAGEQPASRPVGRQTLAAPSVPEPPPPPAGSEEPVGVRARTEVADFADLRGSLVGQQLVAELEQARTLDCYGRLDVAPDAPLSRIRAGWRRTRRRWADGAWRGQHLPAAAESALAELQAGAERAYETLADLRARRDHDAEHAPEGALGAETMDAMYYAEGVFKAAQIRMARGAHAEAVELLQEAIRAYGDEPEYTSYLAWAVYHAEAAGQELPRRIGTPAALLERARLADPQLESASLFRARMADHANRPREAMAAYQAVLVANPDNAEAREAIEGYQAAGLEPETLTRPTLSDRLTRMLRFRS